MSQLSTSLQSSAMKGATGRSADGASGVLVLVQSWFTIRCAYARGVGESCIAPKNANDRE